MIEVCALDRYVLLLLADVNISLVNFTRVVIISDSDSVLLTLI